MLNNRQRNSVRRGEAKQAFLFGSDQKFRLVLAEISDLCGSMIEPAKSFQSNLETAVKVGSIPFLLSHKAAMDSRFSHVLSAENILQLMPELAHLSEEQKRTNARSIANEKFALLLRDQQFIEAIAQQTLDRLDLHLIDLDFMESAEELLRQIVVMVWSAFEVLVNDIVLEMVNINPNIGIKLLKSKPYKDVVGLNSLLEALQEQQFDLRGNFGTLLMGMQKLDTLPKIVAAMTAIELDSFLLKCIGESKLWLLAQQRHLIVHRRGIIDRDFLRNTGCQESVGTKIVLDSQYVQEILHMTASIGCQIIQACNEKTKSI